jgi:RNA polymerase subunit RPABC4/transcription elongation factor Spt4
VRLTANDTINFDFQCPICHETKEYAFPAEDCEKIVEYNYRIQMKCPVCHSEYIIRLDPTGSIFKAMNEYQYDGG